MSPTHKPIIDEEFEKAWSVVDDLRELTARLEEALAAAHESITSDEEQGESGGSDPR